MWWCRVELHAHLNITRNPKLTLQPLNTYKQNSEWWLFHSTLQIDRHTHRITFITVSAHVNFVLSFHLCLVDYFFIELHKFTSPTVYLSLRDCSHHNPVSSWIGLKPWDWKLVVISSMHSRKKSCRCQYFCTKASPCIICQVISLIKYPTLKDQKEWTWWHVKPWNHDECF